MEQKDRPQREGKPEQPGFIERFGVRIVIALCLLLPIVALYVTYSPG
jgi:hypothetical protein